MEGGMDERYGWKGVWMGGMDGRGYGWKGYGSFYLDNILRWLLHGADGRIIIIEISFSPIPILLFPARPSK